MQTLDDLIAASNDRLRLPDPAIRRLLRERARVSQSEIAAVANVDRASVSRWESGAREPRGENLENYLEILDRLARVARGRGPMNDPGLKCARPRFAGEQGERGDEHGKCSPD